MSKYFENVIVCSFKKSLFYKLLKLKTSDKKKFDFINSVCINFVYNRKE